MDFDLLNQNEKAIDLMTGISTQPEDLKKAPDCVCKTIIKRMEELNQEISDCEELLSRLKSEYTTHANFIMNGPFGDLSHVSENKHESPQPYG